jgi:DNA-binding NarL/FixJ family response regulator
VETKTRTKLLLFTGQPFLAEGFTAVLERRPEFELIGSVGEVPNAAALLMAEQPGVALIDMASALSLADLRDLRTAAPRTALVLWGHGLAGEFVFQAVQLGVRGLIPAGTPTDELLQAIHRVGSGEFCFQNDVMEAMLYQKRVVLTPREAQLVSLVAQGLSNKEIATSLDLTPGTVKVYLSRVFKKLNLNDRLDLALYGLKNFFGNQPPKPEQKLVCPRSLPMRTRDLSGVGLLH